MQVGILAGGFGTRLSEETVNIPKPMVQIGEKPILWHIMKMYSNYGFDDFIVMLGYKGHLIKEYFANYFLYQSDVTIDIKNNKLEVLDNKSESWKITLIDTGLNSMTGHRVKRIEKYINDEQFMLTYGDGVSDVNIQKVLDFHNNKEEIATLTAVKPQGRFGSLNLNENGNVSEFVEKPKGDHTWVNGGFFVLEKEVFDYINNDSQNVWETDVLAKLALDNQLNAYKHYGFWQCMDTIREKHYLNDMIDSGNIPWLQSNGDFDG